MLVQCPSCHTTYRVSESLVSKSKPTFRCSRCKNIFVLGSKAAAHTPDEPPAPAPRLQNESSELSFSFPPPETSATAEQNVVESPAPPAATNGPEASPGELESPFDIRQRDQDWSMAPHSDPSEASFTLRDEKSFAEIHNPIEQSFDFASERPAVTKHADTVVETSAESSPHLPLSVTPYLLLCAGLLFLFSSLMLAHKARPEPIESLLKDVPWISHSILKNDHLRRGIVLQAGRPRFQRILGNREVFLLSGAALNRNRVKVREVRIEGYLFGSDGKIIDRQIITVGNVISSKIVRDLTAQEIATLQRQSPIKRFEILPDESAPFSIVFLKSSAEIKSFGYRILSAEEA
jgi:predicted Zn finger-like uncharacterized protein